MKGYAEHLQGSPVSPNELRELCERLDPGKIGGEAPSPAESFDAATILDKLRAATADLVLEEGLLEALAAAVTQGHVILTGPPGTAKSTLAVALANTVKGESWTAATATAEWTVHDVIGGYMPAAGGSITFEPGLVLDSFVGDRWVLIDELNRADIDKAFGELFTILSDFPVSLPNRDPATGERLTVAPHGGEATYVVPENWRLLGTMNTWDKTSLFRLSYAFMRRFAFIEVAVPPEDPYEELIGDFVAARDLTLTEETTLALFALFAGPDLRAVHRELGPAVAQSVIAHIDAAMTAGLSEPDALVSGVRARALPQFEGAFEAHEAIAAALRSCLGEIGEVAAASVDKLVAGLASWTGGGETSSS